MKQARLPNGRFAKYQASNGSRGSAKTSALLTVVGIGIVAAIMFAVAVATLNLAVANDCEPNPVHPSSNVCMAR